MSVYDLEFNKDDVLLRNIIVGFLAHLHNTLCWEQKISNTETEIVDVPFFFTTTGDERFLQNMFLKDIVTDPDCSIAETVYNQIPRAHVDMTGVDIDPSKNTSQYVRGTYDKQVENGVLKTYNAEFIPIPLKLTMDVTIIVDSVLDQFKALESVIRNTYKTNYFQISVAGIRLPCSFGMSDSNAIERNIEFKEGGSDKKETKLTFTVEVDVTYPVFKNAKNGFVGAENTEMFNGNRMVNMTVFNNVGTTASSGVYIDPTLTLNTESLTGNQPSTNIGIDDTIPDNTPWPNSSSAAGLPPQ
jgi:hypothetical protein